MVYRSPFPEVDIPVVPLQDYLFEHAARWPDKAALVDGPTNRTLTYGQLQGAVQRTAAGLCARGFGRGDVFAIYSPNLPEYAVAFLGTATAGGINTTSQSAVHRGRAPRAAQQRRGEVPRHRPCARREGAGSGETH